MSQVAMEASNVEIDNHVEDEIAACLSLKSPQSFFLFAGAGSGKTRSLINALKYVREDSGQKLRLRGQRIGVITYTNAACNEIVQRIDFDSLFQVSTIHSFAWQLIGGFNADIRDWVKANLGSEIVELQELEAKGRPGTKASVARLAQIESKTQRLQNLATIKKFIYNPNGDNRETNSLKSCRSDRDCREFSFEQSALAKPSDKQISVFSSLTRDRTPIAAWSTHYWKSNPDIAVNFVLGCSAIQCSASIMMEKSALNRLSPLIGVSRLRS
jgi:hypothetical protein